MTPERIYAREIIANAPGHIATVIELGAHHGHDTVLLYDAALKDILYIAVEADPRNIPILQQRVEARNVHILHAAVWDDTGMIPLHLSHGNGYGSSSVRQPLKHLEHFPDISFKGATLVPAVKLDSIASAYGVGLVDLIWCDIQGAEKNMILGGRETLARTAWLLTECDRIEMYQGQATRDELLEMLGSDWELVAEWPDDANLLLKNRSVA